MKYSLAIFLIFVCVAFAAQAQLVELAFPCSASVAHDGVGADYVPGVDVDGNAVAPADIGASFEPLQYPMRIPIELDIVRFMGLDVPDGVNADEASLAYIDLFKDGRLEYNGVDITDKVAKDCQASPDVQNNMSVEKDVLDTSEPYGQKDSSSVALEPHADGKVIYGQYP